MSVNPQRRIAIVQVDDQMHAVIGHDDDGRLQIGDLLRGEFGVKGSMTLQNLTTGEDLVAYAHFVESSLGEASTFAR